MEINSEFLFHVISQYGLLVWRCYKMRRLNLLKKLKVVSKNTSHTHTHTHTLFILTAHSCLLVSTFRCTHSTRISCTIKRKLRISIDLRNVFLCLYRIEMNEWEWTLKRVSLSVNEKQTFVTFHIYVSIHRSTVCCNV